MRFQKFKKHYSSFLKYFHLRKYHFLVYFPFKVAVRVFSKKIIYLFFKTFLECFFLLYRMSSKLIRFYFLEFTKYQIFLFYLNHLMNILCFDVLQYLNFCKHNFTPCIRKNLVYVLFTVLKFRHFQENL